MWSRFLCDASIPSNAMTSCVERTSAESKSSRLPHREVNDVSDRFSVRGCSTIPHHSRWRRNLVAEANPLGQQAVAAMDNPIHPDTWCQERHVSISRAPVVYRHCHGDPLQDFGTVVPALGRKRWVNLGYTPDACARVCVCARACVCVCVCGRLGVLCIVLHVLDKQLWKEGSPLIDHPVCSRNRKV